MNLKSETIGLCLHERAELTPERIGLSYRDKFYTWQEIDEITDFLARNYLRMGMKQGEHAALWGVNSPNWVFHYFALVKIGVVTVLINTCFKELELTHVLLDTDVNYLFYGMGCKHVLYQHILSQIDWRELPQWKCSISIEKDSKDKWYQRSDFDEVMSKEDKKLLDQAKKKVSKEDTASILFTSGTTDRPKGVMLSHTNLVRNSRELARQMKWKESDKFCLSVPLFHCFGITAGILSAMHAGADVHVLKYYKSQEVLKAVKQYQCTVLSGVPTMFFALMRNKSREEYDISSIESGIIAGSPLTATEYLDICNTLNIAHLQKSYGQTESSPCITISSYEKTISEKAASSGKKIQDVELEIMDAKTGEILKPGQTGEIITRGYHVMQGYYKRPEETKKAIDRRGWLHTGDLGYLDECGCLHVTGRMKDVIIRGGENISPLEIENCILQMDQVLQVKVIGIPASVLQEEIAACVIPVSGMEVDEEQVKAFVTARLSDYKVPEYVISLAEFPLNESGKVLTKKLKCLAEDIINKRNDRQKK